MPEQLRKKFAFTEELWSRYGSCFRKEIFPAKKILLRENEISKRLFFIEKGSVRACFNHDGKDISFQFFFEGSTVASIESFRKNIPSPVSIETIEPGILWWIQKRDMDRLVAGLLDIPELRNHFIDGLFERTYDYMKHFLSFIRDSPLQRYLNLINDNPQIIQRLPQHYIASYLGISSVHLSRIKSKLAKEKKGKAI